MNRSIHVFFILPLLALLVGSHPALGVEVAEIGAVQSNAEQAVEQTIARLEEATAAGDREAISLAMQALEVAMANFAQVSDLHDRALAGESFDAEVLANCDAVSSRLQDMDARIAAGDLDGARSLFSAANDLAALNPPPPPITDQVLASLAPGLQERMTVAVTQAVETVGGETAAGGPAPGGGGPGPGPGPGGPRLIPMLLMRTHTASPT